MSHEITLITATGDRPEAFKLCESFMSRQTVQNFRWIVVDNGVTDTVTTMGQQVIRMAPCLDPDSSFRLAMLELIKAAGVESVAFIEDDDWYSPDHLATVLTQLQSGNLVGQGHARYYHLGYMMYFTHPNRCHASLCQTAYFGAEMQAALLRCLSQKANAKQLDGHIWKRAGIPDTWKNLLPESTTVVGMKGMPGRGGLGCHHTDEYALLQAGYSYDLNSAVLTELVGADDAINYLYLREEMLKNA